MIGYLQGEILEHSEGKMLLGIGDKRTSGVVGYSVAVPQSHAYEGYGVGQRVELFVYTHVREDALDLFGFHSPFEKTLFLVLLSVNGIGPKSALGILSAVEPTSLVQAIVRGDQAFLTRIPGIGKKTAERVVVELKDSIKKKMQTVTLNSNLKSTQQGVVAFGVADEVETGNSSSSDLLEDAKSALIGLGYREPVVHQMLSRALQKAEIQPTKVEDLVRTALKQLTNIGG